MENMATHGIPVTATVTVFTRHNADCTKKGDRAWKRCNCRKYLYVYEGGRDKTISAKTRSWERAESLAQAERERQLYPEKRKLQEEALPGKNITVAKAVEDWLATIKYKEQRTLTIYMRAGRRLVAWAAEQKIKNFADIIPAKLGQWQSTWGKEATEKYSRLGQASQGQFLDYLKQFCLWAANMGFVAMDPARFLPAIPRSTEQTMPLTAEQFDALPSGVDAFMAAATGEVREWAWLRRLSQSRAHPISQAEPKTDLDG
jgi:hypothetical protein